MRINNILAVLVAGASFALVSCEDSRVDERPLQAGIQSYTPSSAAAASGAQDGENLINQLGGEAPPLNDSGTPGITDPLPIIGGGNTTNTPSVGSGTGTTILGGSAPASQPEENIPAGWIDPNDPTIVISPYNKGHKYRIRQSDGTLMPSGKVLKDNKYPTSTNKKFRIP